MRFPKVSIIIPSFNAEKYISHAIETSLSQSFQDFEIIIINDGSTDATESIVKEFQVKYSDKIVYVYQKNKGLAVTRNVGLEIAKGDYIALLDADDVWLPNRLAVQVPILDEDLSIGLVHANITRITDAGDVIGTPLRNKKYLEGYIFEHIFLRNADIACPTVLFRKACCTKVGNFDPNLTRLGCEDRDLWLRIAKEYKFAYVDEVLSYYRITKNSMSQNLEKMLKARLYVIDKYAPDSGSNHQLRNRALAKVYRDLGDGALLTQNKVLANEYFCKSLRYDPFSWWTWLNLFKSIMLK